MNARALAAMLLLTASACQPTVGDYSVGGTVTGLQGQGVLLTDAAGSGVFVSSDGRFVIDRAFVDGAVYDVAASDPGIPSARCTVAGGKGVIAGADATDVLVTCGEPPEEDEEEDDL